VFVTVTKKNDSIDLFQERLKLQLPKIREAFKRFCKL